MAQDVFSDINPASTSGTQLATLLNAFKAALLSNLSGTSRPSTAVAGTGWIDTTNEGSPNFYWIFKLYTGSTDIEIFRVNLSTSKVSISSADSTFEIAKISADSVGAILKLQKARIASSGQVNASDILGEIDYYGCDNAGLKSICARLKAVALENQTSTALGTALVFEAITATSATLSEVARIWNGKFGVGTTAPATTIHAKGSGIRSEYAADDSNPALFQTVKKRITGTGASQSGDSIGRWEFYTTDDASANSVSARFEVLAAENHTSSALGSLFKFMLAKTTTAVLAEALRIGDVVETKFQLLVNMLSLASQDVATTASINQLSADTAVVRFTGSTATDLRGINSATGKTKVITLHNASTAIVTVKHANGTATAADRFDLPNSRDILIGAGSSAEFFYDATAARWKVKSGSGSGSGGGWTVTSGTRGSPTNVSAGTAPTITTVDAQQLIYVQGNSGHVEMAANPQIGSPGTDGYAIRVRGRNSDQTLTFIDGNGLVLKAEKRTLGADSQLELQWDGTNWVETGFSE